MKRITKRPFDQLTEQDWVLLRTAVTALRHTPRIALQPEFSRVMLWVARTYEHECLVQVARALGVDNDYTREELTP